MPAQKIYFFMGTHAVDVLTVQHHGYAGESLSNVVRQKVPHRSTSGADEIPLPVGDMTVSEKTFCSQYQKVLAFVVVMW